MFLADWELPWLYLVLMYGVYVSSADIKLLSWRSSWRSSQTSIFWPSNRKMPRRGFAGKTFSSIDHLVFPLQQRHHSFHVDHSDGRFEMREVHYLFFFFEISHELFCHWSGKNLTCLPSGLRGRGLSVCISLFLSQCQIEDLLAAQHKRKWTIKRGKVSSSSSYVKCMQTQTPQYFPSLGLTGHLMRSWMASTLWLGCFILIQINLTLTVNMPFFN